jgi:DNA-binding NarL/FixJ family response regulator
MGTVKIDAGMQSGDAAVVLHVDDDPGVTEITGEFLEREADTIEVITEHAASEALDTLSKRPVDCVVSDYDMPGMNGIKLLEAVRDDHPDIPFILFTGKGSEEVASDAISAGVTDYLQKGTGTEQYTVLANRITNAVEAWRSKNRVERLERVRGLVRDVNRSLVRSNTRTELERAVCEHFRNCDPYSFAWITAVEDDTVQPRFAAGIDSRRLSPTALSDVAERTRTALRAPKLVVETTPDLSPQITEAVDAPFRACAVLPLVYQEHVYGTLHIYARSEAVFTNEEEWLLVEVADDVGYGIRNLELRERSPTTE